MVFLARNPDPPEAPAVLPCRLPPCSRPVPLRSALRRTAPASHPCSRLSLSPRPAVLPCFAPSRICRPPSLRQARCLACPAKPSPGLTASPPRYARSVPLRSALCLFLPSCLIPTSHPRTLASLPRPILFCFALPSLRPASPRCPPRASHPLAPTFSSRPSPPSVLLPAAFRTLLTTLRRAAALPALPRRAAVRISPGGPRRLLVLWLARGSRMPAQGVRTVTWTQPRPPGPAASCGCLSCRRRSGRPPGTP